MKRLNLFEAFHGEPNTAMEGAKMAFSGAEEVRVPVIISTSSNQEKRRPEHHGRRFCVVHPMPHPKPNVGVMEPALLEDWRGSG